MQKWEYLVTFIKDSRVAQDKPDFDVYLDMDKYTQALNEYGDAGWELVEIQISANGARAVLKRPKPA